MSNKVEAAAHGLDGGWARPFGAGRSHYFTKDALRSLCGRSFWTGPRAGDQEPGSCIECDAVYEQQVVPELEEV